MITIWQYYAFAYYIFQFNSIGQLVDRRIQGNCHKGDLTVNNMAVKYEIINIIINRMKKIESHRP